MRRIRIPAILLTVLFLGLAPVSGQESLPDLVKRIKPSVVAIITYDSKGERLSRGSGFFNGPNLVVTNKHVIENAYRVEIHLSGGSSYTAKGVVAVDGEGDIAILQVDLPPGIARPLSVGRTSPQEGEAIVVIGNPLGLEGSVSNGIVSAVREIPNFGRIIQITAPISPGSSGSPVVNMQGQVIGVATLQLTDGQSLNFAVPSERVAQMQSGTLTSLSDLVSASKRNQRASAERFYSQGLGYLSRDNCEKALPYFKKAVESDPNYADAWAKAGYCSGMLGQNDDALKASKQALRLRPESADAYINIGTAYALMKQYKESAEAYRQAVRLDPNNADTYVALGSSYGKMGRTEDEIQAYRRAINLRPDHAAAVERLGLGYLKLNRNNEAVEAFKQRILLKPDDASAFDNMGVAYLRMKKYDEAIEALKHAIQLKPDFGRAYYNLGLTYFTQGDRDSALVQYNILKSLDADRAEKLFDAMNP
jgi:tetratricopeptide (TPR) repeat protein